MPIKSHGEKPMPENKREHKAVKADETRMRANEGRGEKGVKSARGE